jgi:hypothetical protein
MPSGMKAERARWPPVTLRRRGLAVKAWVQGGQGARVRLRGPDRARSRPDCGRGGWGRAGRLGGTRAAKVGEDGLAGEGVLDGGDNTQPAATAGTSEDIEGEDAGHQRRPGPGVRGDGSAGAGLLAWRSKADGSYR